MGILNVPSVVVVTAPEKSAKTNTYTDNQTGFIVHNLTSFIIHDLIGLIVAYF